MQDQLQLLVTLVRLDDYQVSDAAVPGGPKLYLSFNVNGETSSLLPRITLDSLPERLSFLNLTSGAGQRVNVELRSSHGKSGLGILQQGVDDDDNEVLAKGSFLVDSTVSKKNGGQRDQLFSLKMWDTQGKGNAIGTLQMLVDAISTEQQQQQRHQQQSSIAQIVLAQFARWGWVLNLVALLVASAAKLGLLFAPTKTTTTVDKLPIGKIVLRRGTSLAQGDFVASCVGSSSERFCRPVHLILHGSNGSLALRTGASPTSQGGETLWESTQHKGRLFQDFRATVTDAGDLAVLRGKQIVWRLDYNDVKDNQNLTDALMWM